MPPPHKDDGPHITGNSTLKVAVNTEEDSLIIQIRCPQCGQTAIAMSLSHVPMIQAVLKDVMQHYDVRPQTVTCEGHTDCTPEEMAAAFREGTN